MLNEQLIRIFQNKYTDACGCDTELSDKDIHKMH